jgi:Na+/proline symporter
MRLQGHARDHAEAAAATASQSPEQIGVGAGVGDTDRPVRGHQLGFEQTGASHPERFRQASESAALNQPCDAHCRASSVVENNGEDELRRAVWLFPLYLILINLFVIPIAIAGLLIFPKGSVDSDMFVLSLPMFAGSSWLALFAFVGGLSAATAMVIVESVAVAIMVSNDLVVPFMLRRRGGNASRADMHKLLLLARRFSIFCVLFLAYLYYHLAGEAQLAQIGLLSFAAVAQFGPAFFGGLFWREARADFSA